MSMTAKARTPPPPATATLTRRGSLYLTRLPTGVGGTAMRFGDTHESQSVAGPILIPRRSHVRRVKTGKGWNGLLAGMGLMLMLRGAPAQALQAEQPQPPPKVVPVTNQRPSGQESQAQAAPGETELLHVLVGQPLEVSSPSPIKGFSVSSPGIIDAALQNPNQIRIDGKAPGGVSLVVQAENGQTQVFYVYVELKDTGTTAQLPEVLTDNPAPAQVPKKKTAWLGWAVMGSMLLLAGALIKVLRQREPYKLDLRSPQLVPPDRCSEPALSPPEIAHRGEASPPEAVVQAATTRAEDLERVGQELAEQWWRQFRTEAEAAMAGLREEIKNSGQVLEESTQRLACLAEAKAASIWEARQEEFSMQMATALREHAQEMHEATAAEMESIKKAAGEAVAQLEAAEDKSESSFASRAGEAEKRLAGVSVALEAVEGRIKALVEGFEGRIESSLQAVQGKIEKQAEDLEKLAQDLGGRWSDRFQNHAEAAIEKLREEANLTRQAEEESRRQSAGMFQANLERFNQAVASATAALAGRQEKWAEERQRQSASMFEPSLERLNQAVTSVTAALAAKQEKRAEESQRQSANMFEASLERLNLAVASATAGLAAQQEKWEEESRRQSASIFEANLERLNQAVASATAGLAAKQEKWVEESQRQLSSVVLAKVESLSQFAVSVTASLQAEHTQLKNEYETSRREFEHLVSRRPPAAPFLPARRENGRKPRRLVPRLAMGTGIFLAVSVPVLAVYLWPAPVMQLPAQPPAEFLDDSANWGSARRVREQEVARAYWQVAVADLQGKYPFGSELPIEPPSEFDAGKRYLQAAGPKAASETRDHYWQKLRKIWVRRDSWEESTEWDAQWASRLKHLWGQGHEHN